MVKKSLLYLFIAISFVICFTISLSILIISKQTYEEIKAIRNVKFVIWVDNCSLPNNYKQTTEQIAYNISLTNATTEIANSTGIFKRSNTKKYNNIYPRKGSSGGKGGGGGGGSSGKTSNGNSGSSGKTSSIGVSSGDSNIANKISLINALLFSMRYRNIKNVNSNNTFMYNYLDFTKGLLELDENANLNFEEHIVILSIISISILIIAIFVGFMYCYYNK